MKFLKCFTSCSINLSLSPMWNEKWTLTPLIISITTTIPSWDIWEAITFLESESIITFPMYSSLMLIPLCPLFTFLQDKIWIHSCSNYKMCRWENKMFCQIWKDFQIEMLTLKMCINKYCKRFLFKILMLLERFLFKQSLHSLWIFQQHKIQLICMQCNKKS